jgi:hypothetical protein
MRNSTAYFAGVATVFSAIALGFAGAMMLTATTTAPSPTDHSERHWARRHYRDDEAASDAQDAKSGGQNTQSQPSASENQSAAQGQTQPTQINAADQASATVDDSDAVQVKRKHDRRWTRGYARDHNERRRDDGRARSFEARELPGEDAPQTSSGVPRWRPFFSDGDDD